MKKLLQIIVVAIAAASVAGCMTKSYKPTKSSLELQSIQTKEFETPLKTGFASTMSVFQDLGYIIATADADSGLITASSPKSQEMVPFVGMVMKNRKVTAFVEPINKDKIRIRINFVDEEESSNGYGMKGGSVIPIEDPKIYQEAFDKIQKAIFVRSSLS